MSVKMIAATPASSKRLRDFERRHFGGLRPAFDRDLAVARIEPDRDAAGKFLRGASFTSSGSRTAAVPMMTRAMPLASQASTVAGRGCRRRAAPGCVTAFRIASTASAFIGLPAKAPSRSTTCRYSKPWCCEARRLRGRIEVEHGCARHVALLEAHALAVLEVDGGKEDHGFHFRKLAISARPSAGSSRDGTACRRRCRGRRSPSPARHSRRAPTTSASSRGGR